MTAIPNAIMMAVDIVIVLMVIIAIMAANQLNG